MKQQQGFTLIELIIVIVILGILAVTAAPRFIDIQSDARSETLQGVKAAVQGASQLVYAKAAIKGVQKAESESVSINGDTVATRYGYPDADTVTTPAILQRFVDIEIGPDADTNTFELALDTMEADDDKFQIKFQSIADNCYIEFTSAGSAGQVPTYTVVTTGC